MSKSTQDANKMSFWFGFFAGVSAISVIVFIGLFVMVVTGFDKTMVGNTAGGTVNQPTAVAPTPTPAAPAPEPAGGPVVPIKDGEYVKGPADAPIEIIEYSDFECPFCARFADTLEQVVAEYRDQVKIVYRHFPLSFHVNAPKAAEASECAGEQGKFWEMHDQIFIDAELGNMTVTRWKDVAGELNLNQSQFDDCLDSGKYAQKVLDDMAEGQAAGVTGTPGTFINGKVVRGALPFAQIKTIIDTELAAQQ